MFKNIKLIILTSVFSTQISLNVSSMEYKESIVESTFKNLRTAAHSSPSTKDIRIMESEDFQKIFPKVDKNDLDRHSGKLQMDFGYFWLGWTWSSPYVGSGTLTKYDQEKNEFEGITAKHNLFDTSAYFFTTASGVFFNICEHEGNRVARIRVTSYIPHPKLDICLFYGKYEGNNEELVKERLPIEIDDEVLDDNSNHSFEIIHYPNGTADQRKNEGKAKVAEDKQHCIYETDTLGGSSGAPLFHKNEKKLFGIHISSGTTTKDCEIHYKNNVSVDKLKVSKYNKCVLINNDLIVNMREGKRYNL